MNRFALVGNHLTNIREGVLDAHPPAHCGTDFPWYILPTFGMEIPEAHSYHDTRDAALATARDSDPVGVLS